MAAASYKPEWQKSGRFKLLLTTINAGTSPNQEGGVTFTDYDFGQYFDLLPDAFRYPAEITRTEFRSIVYRAAIGLRKTGQITAETLVDAVNQGAISNLKLPSRRYTMWTVLRLRNMPRAGSFRLKFDEVTLEGRRSLPHWLRLEKYFISGIGDIEPTPVGDFGYLIARVNARTEDGAAKRIYDACDAFFALANIYWRSWPLWTDRHAEAKLWMWHYQFFWERRRFLGREKIWFNPSFDEAEWKRFPGDFSKFAEALPYIRKALSKLEIHPLRHVLFQAARLVHEGMSSPDLSFRLLRYWSAMERLYSESDDRNAPYDRLIRRLTFAENDRELAIMKLEHLSKLRNAYVHSGSTDNDRNELTQFLGRVLEHQIRYILMRGTDFLDHGELIEMADLPSDLGLLERRKRSIERRENIIRHGRHYTTQ